MAAEPHLLAQWNVDARTHWKQLSDVFWVTDFPMFEHAETGTGYQSCHHPFTAPIPAHLPLLADAVSAITSNAPLAEIQSKLLAITAQHYDLVYNGVEVAGGSIRCVAGCLALLAVYYFNSLSFAEFTTRSCSVA
jgi:aspartyl-tRNA synthetase